MVVSYASDSLWLHRASCKNKKYFYFSFQKPETELIYSQVIPEDVSANKEEACNESFYIHIGEHVSKFMQYKIIVLIQIAVALS